MVATFLKNLVFPAADAGANETFTEDHPHDHEHADEKGHSHDHEHEPATEKSALLATTTDADDFIPINHGSEQDRVLFRLKVATALCLAFMLVEIIGGLIAGSLAVLSDAAHLLADLASFAVAIVAAHLASLPSTETHTYGLKRTESLAALFSMACLAVVSIGLAVEAVRRIVVMFGPGEDELDIVDGKLMSLIATIGVLVNVALALVLGENHVHMPGFDDSGHGHDHSHSHGHGHDHNKHEDEEIQQTLSPRSPRQVSGEPIHANEVPPEDGELPQAKPRNVNLHAAYLHVMADLAQSVAVLIAGLVIWAKPEWQIVDPIATILFCILVFYSTLGVIRSAVCVLLEEVPPHVSWSAVNDAIVAVDGVTNVHDLHIWSISQGVTALSVHVHAAHANVDSRAILRSIAEIGVKHSINHATVQVQPYSKGSSSDDEICETCDIPSHSSAQHACMSSSS